MHGRPNHARSYCIIMHNGWSKNSLCAVNLTCAHTVESTNYYIDPTHMHGTTNRYSQFLTFMLWNVNFHVSIKRAWFKMKPPNMITAVRTMICLRAIWSIYVVHMRKFSWHSDLFNFIVIFFLNKKSSDQSRIHTYIEPYESPNINHTERWNYYFLHPILN